MRGQRIGQAGLTRVSLLSQSCSGGDREEEDRGCWSSRYEDGSTTLALVQLRMSSCWRSLFGEVGVQRLVGEVHKVSSATTSSRTSRKMAAPDEPRARANGAAKTTPGMLVPMPVQEAGSHASPERAAPLLASRLPPTPAQRIRTGL